MTGTVHTTAVSLMILSLMVGVISPADVAQLGPVVVLVGIIINIAWGAVQRHWQEADRKASALQLETERKETAVHVEDRLEQRAAELRTGLEQRAEVIAQRQQTDAAKLEELLTALGAIAADLGINTRLTQASLTRADEAFTEANNSNAKTAQDTNARVRTIQEGLTTP